MMDQTNGERRLENDKKMDAVILAAYGRAPDLPINADLLERLTETPSQNIVGIGSSRRSYMNNRLNFPPAAWGSIAASLFVGALIGYWAQPETDGIMIATADGKLAARGILAEQLDSQISFDPSAGPVDVGLTFKSANGLCRTFSYDNQFAGLSCREGRVWRVAIIVNQAGEFGENEYRLASTGLPSSVMAVVDSLIEGEPLSAESEKNARRSGWTGQ